MLHKTTTSYIESLVHPHVVWSISTHTTEAAADVARRARKARGRHIISAEGGTCIRSRRARVGAEPRLTEGRATAAATTTEGARRTGTSEACYVAEATAVVARCARKARGRHISAEGGTCSGRIGAKTRLVEGRAAAAAGQATKDC